MGFCIGKKKGRQTWNLCVEVHIASGHHVCVKQLQHGSGLGLLGSAIVCTNCCFLDLHIEETCKKYILKVVTSARHRLLASLCINLNLCHFGKEGIYRFILQIPS